MKKSRSEVISSVGTQSKQQRIDQPSQRKESPAGQDGWSAVNRVRLPHKAGLPLGSGGGGDAIER